MDEQQRLSAAYSDLKDRHFKLKSDFVLLRIKANNLDEQNKKLSKRVADLEIDLEKVKDESILVLPKNSASGLGNYVTLKRFNKKKKLIDDLTDTIRTDREKLQALTNILDKKRLPA